MAKRKDRRVPAVPNRGLNRVEHAVQRDRTASSSSSSIRFTTYFCIIIFIPMISFSVYRMKYASHTEGIATAIVSSSVYERGLVRPNINYQEILNENSDVSNNSTRRHYTYPILAYITPWNSRGYDLAKRFNSKFTHLSPVWYDLKSEGIRLVLEGRHNADIGWLSELRKSGPALVLPRVVLEAFPNELLKKKKKRNEAIDPILVECANNYHGIERNGKITIAGQIMKTIFLCYLSNPLFPNSSQPSICIAVAVLPRIVLEAFPNELLKKKKKRNEAIDLILAECKEMKYDGIVLESWSRWAAYGVLHDQQMRSKALQFVKELGQALHSVSSVRNPEHYLQLVYVIGPPHSKNLQEHDFGPEDLQTLGDAVDGFSLMTYDFSGPQNPGPNAPLKWIKSTLELFLSNSGNKAQSLARKIFLGINFYGNDFVLSQGQGGGAITGRDYLSLLEKHRPTVKWDEDSEEHLFAYSDKQGIKHAVFYPTLMSISMRLEEARMWGAGISIWEIGQANGYDLDLSPSVHSFAVLRARFKGKLIAKNVGLA